MKKLLNKKKLTQDEKIDLLISKLESNTYDQGKGRLCLNGKYCCLAVACEIAREYIRLNVRLVEDNNNKDLFKTYDGERNSLPPRVLKWFGFKTHLGGMIDSKNSYKIKTKEKRTYNTLAGINDSGDYTFRQIADIIRKHKDKIFNIKGGKK